MNINVSETREELINRLVSALPDSTGDRAMVISHKHNFEHEDIARARARDIYRVGMWADFRLALRDGVVTPRFKTLLTLLAS